MATTLRCRISLVAVGICVFLSQINSSAAQNWNGELETYRVQVEDTCRRCLCQYSWGCSRYRYWTCCVWATRYRCAKGWRHNGDRNCNIPICSPTCGNGGECTGPNECDCKGLATGTFCRTQICSRDHPCYPGICYEDNHCNCTEGFMKRATLPEDSDPGCLKFEDDNIPYIGRSSVILSHIRRTSNTLLYYFLLDGTNETPEMRVVWSNQQIFNQLRFEFETTYVEPAELPERPGYVHQFEYGIVGGDIFLQVFNFKGEENVAKGRYNFTCPGASENSPIILFNCTIDGEEFKTLIEHGDTLKATLTAENGGYRRFIYNNAILPREFLGKTKKQKVLEFKFDFETPRHCSTNRTRYTCNTNDSMLLHVVDEFTKEPVEVEWQGWVDSDMYSAGVMMYYFEVHKLMVKDNTLELTETDPVNPMKTAEMMHTDDLALFNKSFTPDEPGMYSILMEVRDGANNSIYARRFVLYDPVSEITTDPQSIKGLHVASAEEESNYKWQSNIGDIMVDWTGFFRNKMHSDGYFLNAIKRFPEQFKDFEDLGIRNCKKFLFDTNDDITDGSRTRSKIQNANGIVKFEYSYEVLGQNRTGWIPVDGFQYTQTQRIDKSLSNGDQITVWIRAHDMMGNILDESTTVTMDYTNPLFGPSNSSAIPNNETEILTFNDNSGMYNYSSKYEFYAHDPESGVHQIVLNITLRMTDENTMTISRTMEASMDKKLNPTANPMCSPTMDKITCFLEKQTVYMDNCWLMVPNKDYLHTASATVDVIIYNQAMHTNTTSFSIPRISDLAGLSVYNGPENIKVVNQQSDSFRITWDLPAQLSCYGRAPIVIIILFKDSTGGNGELRYVLSSTATYLDVGGLEPEKDYSVSFFTQLGGGSTSDAYTSFYTKTPAVEEGVALGLILGIAGGVVLLLIIALVVLIVMARMGKINPGQKAAQVRRAVSRKYRQTFYGGSGGVGNPAYRGEEGHATYDNRHRETDIYIDGVDIDTLDIALVCRTDVSLNNMLTSGNFANIYMANLSRGKTQECVVAKTLKQGYTTENEKLMKAKISFLGTTVGDHPNVLKFIGAVTDDPNIGPFILHEYCDNGTLKEYLVKQKGNVTMQLQEILFQFGLFIAKGMEYLADKGITHKRLAARNILLTFLNEVKITGFGPQPDEDADGIAAKEERIPVKWTAPECMKSTMGATEKSDVWSYAVVLWEIFSLGETPYGDMKSREIPSKIKKGIRLQKPEQCDDVWYEEMKKCWEYYPSKRPTFTDIRTELDDLFVGTPGDDYYYARRN